MFKIKRWMLVIPVAIFLVLTSFFNMNINSVIVFAVNFSDNFSDGNDTGWTRYGGTWAVESGEYSVTSGSADKSVFSTSTASNYTLEADLKIINSGQGSLIFGIQSASTGTDSFQGYSAGIETNGTVWIGKHNNNWQSLGSTTMTITAGTWYHLKVVVNSGNIKLFVGGVEKVSVNDSTYSAGKVGVRGGFNNHVHFDNIVSTDTTSGTGTGLTGAYFDNMDLTNQKLTRTDATINFNWGTGSPDSSIGVDSFSIRWTGQIQPRYSETYTFYITSDNGRRVWVNNQLIIDKWIDDWDITYSGTISLTAGVKYDIKIEYFENNGGANIKLEWQSASQAREVVPQSQLYPSSTGVTTFNDDFNDGNANGWTSYGGNWSVSSGQYCVDGGMGSKSVANGTSFTRLTYEADVMVGATGNAGLIFRVNNPTVGADAFYGYYVGIDAEHDQVQLGKMSNNWTEIKTAYVVINANTMYHLKLIMDGTYIWAFVTDMTTPLISRSDSTHTAGAIGVRTFNTAARFDNIAVTSDIGTTPPPPVTYNWSWIRGAVFVPTNVVNEVQQWDEYNSAVNDRELYYASVYGINCVRVYLHYLVWEKNKTLFLSNIEDFLTRANSYGIKTEFVFFDDCWNPNPSLGPYPAPLFGVHNSRWVQCPGNYIKENYASYKINLKAYVQDVVNAHKTDSRIAFWEPYNEPGNGQSGLYYDVTNQILSDSRTWIKETGTTIPITSTDFAGTIAAAVSDFYSWHPYDSGYSGPRGPEVLVTECMNRNSQSVPGVDNAFYHNANPTGYIMWEAGIGRDNCRYPWGNTSTEPTTPFHGVIYPDGHPWSLDDVKAIRNDDLSTAPVFNVEYFTGNFQTSKKVSVTPMIDFDLGNEFGTGSPDASMGIGTDNFSIRWTGKVLPSAAGTYTFYCDSDNIAKLWIGTTQVVNKTTSGRSEVSGTISLSAGVSYDLKVEYYHNTGDASMHVKWSGPSLSKRVLPGRR